MNILFVVGMLIFGVGVFKLVADNILLILLAVAVLIALLVLFSKWPGPTIVVLAVFLLVIWGGTSIEKTSKEDSIPVQVYRTSGDCTVYDIDHNTVTIPCGAVVAMYTDNSERQSEYVGGTLYAGFTRMCYWYYEGEVHSFCVSTAMDSQWEMEEVKEISYKEFKHGDWWKLP